MTNVFQITPESNPEIWAMLQPPPPNNQEPNDGDDDLVEFNFDDFDFDDSAQESSGGVEPDYIKRHIARIPQHGDNSRWRLADYLNMFDNLNRNGTLTPEQREAVDNFVVGYQSNDYFDDDCREPRDACTRPCDTDCTLPCDDEAEMDFPECQYVANGLDWEKAQQLGDTYRAGECIPQIGHEAADRISNRLNQMQSRRTALRK